MGDVILGENILADDAVELTHNFWRPVSIITNISALLHHQNREVGVFYLNEFMTYSELEQRDTIAKQNYNLKSVVFLISVGSEATNNCMEVFFTTPKKEGCHWSVLHTEFQGSKWTYCDTLGWETPVNLKSKVDSVLRIFVEELNVPVKPMHGIKKAHSFNMNTSNEHECNKYCLPNIPLQTCQNVCGVISVIMASLCVVSPHVWSCLISSDCTLLPEELHWLKHPTMYSDYLRTVLISWLINNEVNPENLGISQQVLAMEQAKKLSPCSFVKKDRIPMFIPRTLDTQSVSNTPYLKETKESSSGTERKVKQASPDVIKDSSSPPVSSFKNSGSNNLPNSSAESNSNTTSVIILKSVKIGVSGKSVDKMKHVTVKTNDQATEIHSTLKSHTQEKMKHGTIKADDQAAEVHSTLESHSDDLPLTLQNNSNDSQDGDSTSDHTGKVCT